MSREGILEFTLWGTRICRKVAGRNPVQCRDRKSDRMHWR